MTQDSARESHEHKMDMMTDATMDWPDLFPDTPYAFHLKLRKCPVEEFFRPRHPAGTTLAERRRWLSQAPE